MNDAYTINCNAYHAAHSRRDALANQEERELTGWVADTICARGADSGDRDELIMDAFAAESDDDARDDLAKLAEPDLPDDAILRIAKRLNAHLAKKLREAGIRELGLTEVEA